MVEGAVGPEPGVGSTGDVFREQVYETVLKGVGSDESLGELVLGANCRKGEAKALVPEVASGEVIGEVPLLASWRAFGWAWEPKGGC